MSMETEPNSRQDEGLPDLTRDESTKALPPAGFPRPKATSRREAGLLFVNADDWGRTRDTTDKTYDCIRRRSVSSVSAMVFMEDSERAAKLAQEHKIETGLHLNLTAPFS